MSIMPQINHHDPFAPIVRRASAPAPQTHASRQSVGTHAGLHREDVPSTTQEQKPKRTGYDGVPLTLRRRQLVSAEDDVPEEEEEAYDDEWPTRLPSSARRYVQPLAGTRYQAHADHVIPRRRGQANRATPPKVIYAGAAAADQPTQVHRQRSFLRRAHPFLWLGLGMFSMLFLWVGLTALVSLWSIHLDDVTYGRPRTAQYDVVVGHHDSPSNPSHFIAMNLHGTAVVVELSGGDTSKAKIYKGPQLLSSNADLIPVTVTFSDVNHDGKLDMLMHVQGDTVIYLNQNGQFVQQPAR